MSKTLKLGAEMKTISTAKNIHDFRQEVRGIIEQRYAPNHHHVMIHSVEPFGHVHVVLFIVETSAYYHRRVGIIVDGRMESDMIAAQE